MGILYIRLLLKILAVGGGNPIQFAAVPGNHRVDIRPLDPEKVCRRVLTLRNVRYYVPQSQDEVDP